MKHLLLQIPLAALIFLLSFSAQAKQVCTAFNESHFSIPARITPDLRIVTANGFNEVLADVRQQVGLVNFHPKVRAESYKFVQISPDRQSVLLKAFLEGEDFHVVYNLKRGIVWSHHGNVTATGFLGNSAVMSEVTYTSKQYRWVDDFVSGESRDLTPFRTRMSDQILRLLDSVVGD